MLIKKLYQSLSLVFLGSLASEAQGIPVKISTVNDVVALFPKTAQEINDYCQAAIEGTTQRVNKIIAIPAHERTYENTVRAYDQAIDCISRGFKPINALEMVSPDASIRKAAHDKGLELQKACIDLLTNNVAMYQAFEDYAQGNAVKEQLSQTERYFLNETITDFKRNGLNLPEATLKHVKALNKEIADLCQQFGTNIAEDTRKVTVTRAELDGLPEEFINALQRDAQGNYLLGTDYPTFFMVIDECSVESTRKKLNTLFMQRAYPANVDILNKIVEKRMELAKLLKFNSYADLDIDNQMAKTVSRVQHFLNDLIAKATIKAQQEMELLTKQLPASVQLTEGNKVKQWDLRYINKQYIKKHFKIDESVIAEYFPMEQSIKGLIEIFEQFMSLKIKEVAVSGLWHDDVKLLEIYDQKGTRLRGYIVLDLFPRDNKYGHAASSDIIVPMKDKQGNITAAVNLVIANFPKSTAVKPSLLKHDDVVTFFHEFGHAIHALLGATEIISLSGTCVKTDFVELPSQILEEWMWDKEILKKISSHYKTGQPLPDDVIDKKIELKKFNSGQFFLRQMYYAKLSLEYFLQGSHKDLSKISQDLFTSIMFYLAWDNTNQNHVSFGHLTDYGAKYYGYAWSKVFALDMAAEIRKYGFLNPEIGQKYVDTILAPGGSIDPNELLKSFLGREPNSKAFFKDLGIN